MAVKLIEGKTLPKKDTKLYTHVTLTRLKRINLKLRGR
jgi:hypothetical protein